MRWPVTLRWGEIALRPLRRTDARRWSRVRRDNAAWLRPWEATLPAADPGVPATFGAMVRANAREARAGRAEAFALDVDDVLMGQVTLGGIAWGSLRSAYIGYWISQEVAGRGIMPRAVALVTDHAFADLGLHRIEINVRPENTASLRVVAKVGYREEGYRPKYLHIDGAWRDHVSFVMLADEWPSEGVARRLAATQGGAGARGVGRSVHNSDTPDPVIRDRVVRDTGDSLPGIGT